MVAYGSDEKKKEHWRKIHNYEFITHKSHWFGKCNLTNTIRPDESFSSKLNSVALVRERTIPTERPPPVGEVSANFCG